MIRTIGVPRPPCFSFIARHTRGIIVAIGDAPYTRSSFTIAGLPSLSAT